MKNKSNNYNLCGQKEEKVNDHEDFIKQILTRLDVKRQL